MRDTSSDAPIVQCRHCLIYGGHGSKCPTRAVSDADEMMLHWADASPAVLRAGLRFYMVSALLATRRAEAAEAYIADLKAPSAPTKGE